MFLRRQETNSLFRFLVVSLFPLILWSCDETNSQQEPREASRSNDVGFEALIEGSYRARVSGRGVLVLLPEAGFEKQGYFFLADGQGIRPHGVTFVLPRGLAPGKHKLASPSPLAIGTMPSVRVDREMGNSVLSSEKNTSGFLDLIVFPDDESKLNGSDVAGSFELETEDLEGLKITVKGTFSFKVK